MKKKMVKKLALNRETLHALEKVSGGAFNIVIRQPLGGTNEISICLSCTGKLDTCPDIYATIG